VSLHCKAGKGRAGIMAACLMVRMGETAHTAVASFDAVRSAGEGEGFLLFSCNGSSPVTHRSLPHEVSG